MMNPFARAEPRLGVLDTGSNIAYTMTSRCYSCLWECEPVVRVTSRQSETVEHHFHVFTAMISYHLAIVS